MEQLITRPGLDFEMFKDLIPAFGESLAHFDVETVEQAEIQVKYEGYIKKEREMADKMVRLDDIVLPEQFDYHRVTALSFEGREKLSRVKPKSLGQASRISGVTPADISVLMVFIGR